MIGAAPPRRPFGHLIRRAFADWSDPVSRDLGASGELFVARFRLGLVVLVSFVPLTTTLAGPAMIENWLGLLSVLVALLVAFAFLALASRPTPPPHLGFATSQFDVGIVTLGFVSFIVAQRPIIVTNSLVQYTVYFVALAGTGFRYDPRISVAAGVAALVQYGALVCWVAWTEPSIYMPSPDYGRFQWDSQVSRLLLLAVATIINTAVTVRSRQFWLNSRRDRPTGLFNRGFFDESLARLMAAPQVRTATFSVAIIDLDHFKRVNDEHGHAAGDAALRRASEHLLDMFREQDLIARFGGDEFAAILRMEHGTAEDRLNAWRAGLAKPTADLPLSASVGVASYPADGTSLSTLLLAADRRLYAAKRRGGNRVVSDDRPADAS